MRFAASLFAMAIFVMCTFLRIITPKDQEDLLLSSFTIAAMLLTRLTTWTGTNWTVEKLPLCSQRIVAKLLKK